MFQGIEGVINWFVLNQLPYVEHELSTVNLHHWFISGYQQFGQCLKQTVIKCNGSGIRHFLCIGTE